MDAVDSPQKINNYAIYIYKVLKQVHPELELSDTAMSVLNILVNYVFDVIYFEATKCAQYAGRFELSIRDVRSAVSLVLPGELAKCAQWDGARAVNKYHG